MELFRNNCYSRSKGTYNTSSSIIKHILNECWFFQAICMIGTSRKNWRISSYHTSVVHQAQTYILPSKVFLLVDWEPLPEVARLLISTELQVAQLHARQIKYWSKMQHIKVMEDPPPKIEFLLKYIYYFYSCFQSWGDKKCEIWAQSQCSMEITAVQCRMICTDFVCFFFIWENASSAQEIWYKRPIYNQAHDCVWLCWATHLLSGIDKNGVNHK